MSENTHPGAGRRSPAEEACGRGPAQGAGSARMAGRGGAWPERHRKWPAGAMLEALPCSMGRARW